MSNEKDANFTPDLGNYKSLQPFRFWCQKVLPLVYDDSLSYYELLCKVVDYLNKTMEDVETLHGDVTNLHTAYEELQSYVNNYFRNLDVQTEIDNKLDEMVASGELSTLIMPFVKSSPVIVKSKNEMVNHNYIYLLESDGILYYWDGTDFIASGINYTYPINSYTAHLYRLLNSENTISELKECGAYSIGIRSNSDKPSDMPDGWGAGNFLVVVDGYIGSGTNGYVQTIYSDVKSYYYYRVIVGDSVGEWTAIGGNFIFKRHTYQFLTSANTIKELNDFGTYSIGIRSNSDKPSDMPDGWSSGNFLVVVDGYIGSGTNGYVQTIYSDVESYYYYRVIVGDSVGEWTAIGKDNPHAKLKIALCGDSFIAKGGDGGLTMADYLNEFDKYNAVSLAKGGIQASQWWEEFKTNVDSSYDAFLISLGLNGESSVSVFKSSLESIINNITSINPTARIIIWCMDAWYPEDYSNACKEISATYGIEYYSMLANKNIPIRINGKYDDVFPNLNKNFAAIKTNAYRISENDNHPNIKGRKMLAEFWSTIL